jgi:microcystin-dependent protein
MSRKLSPPSRDTVKDEIRRLQEEAHTRRTRQISETGLVQMYLGLTAPEGWLILNGDTIGKNGSGATHMRPDLKSLFAVLWDSFANTELAILDEDGVASTRGASAQADWAANKRMPLPDCRSRCVIGTGDGGAGLTDRTHGAKVGAETHTLTEAEMPAHTHSTIQSTTISYTAGGVNAIVILGGGGVTGSTGGGGAHANMQPSIAFNFIVKT